MLVGENACKQTEGDRILSRSRQLIRTDQTKWPEVVLDLEIALNNRPLCYVEDDIQLPVLTLNNSLLFLRSNQLPELEPHHLREFDLRRRANKYLRMCKQASWTGGLPNIYEG